jgi:hypothetical protein
VLAALAEFIPRADRGGRFAVSDVIADPDMEVATRALLLLLRPA